MLKRIGVIETLYNTRLHDKDEMKLRHAPCPGQGRIGDLFSFLQIFTVPNTNIGSCTSD